jgi:hypothetical protein
MHNRLRHFIILRRIYAISHVIEALTLTLTARRLHENAAAKMVGTPSCAGSIGVRYHTEQAQFVNFGLSLANRFWNLQVWK